MLSLSLHVIGLKARKEKEKKPGAGKKDAKKDTKGSIKLIYTIYASDGLKYTFLLHIALKLLFVAVCRVVFAVLTVLQRLNLSVTVMTIFFETL